MSGPAYCAPCSFLLPRSSVGLFLRFPAKLEVAFAVAALVLGTVIGNHAFSGSPAAASSAFSMQRSSGRWRHRVARPLQRRQAVSGKDEDFVSSQPAATRDANLVRAALVESRHQGSHLDAPRAPTLASGGIEQDSSVSALEQHLEFIGGLLQRGRPARVSGLAHGPLWLQQRRYGLCVPEADSHCWRFICTRLVRAPGRIRSRCVAAQWVPGQLGRNRWIRPHSRACRIEGVWGKAAAEGCPVVLFRRQRHHRPCRKRASQLLPAAISRRQILPIPHGPPIRSRRVLEGRNVGCIVAGVREQSRLEGGSGRRSSTTICRWFASTWARTSRPCATTKTSSASSDA